MMSIKTIGACIWSGIQTIGTVLVCFQKVISFQVLWSCVAPEKCENIINKNIIFSMMTLKMSLTLAPVRLDKSLNSMKITTHI